MTDTVTPENTESTADTFIDAEIVPVVESDTGPHAGDVLERQLDAGQDLSTHLIEATTDAAVAVVESPAKVIAAIRSGATLPAALGETNEAVQEADLELAEPQPCERDRSTGPSHSLQVSVGSVREP